jgi:hypothetical protein
MKNGFHVIDAEDLGEDEESVNEQEAYLKTLKVQRRR